MNEEKESKSPQTTISIHDQIDIKEVEPEKSNKCKKCKKYNITFKQSFDTIFTVTFGSSCIILLIVLSSDLKPDMLPFKIVPIEFNKSTNAISQLSIFFTFVSFITSNVLFMRIVLCFSFGLGILSKCLTPLPIDFSYIVWCFLVFLINLKHVMILFYSKRHISFDQHREQIYTTIFNNITTRSEFQTLMSHSLIRIIRKDRYYININDTCNNLTILVSGTMLKSDKTNKKSQVKELSFIDSPEFIMQKQMVGQIFNVSFFAETECVILIWSREMINELLEKDKKLKEQLLSVLGLDVAYKVFVLDVLVGEASDSI